jgi:hypothetical protein
MSQTGKFTSIPENRAPGIDASSLVQKAAPADDLRRAALERVLRSEAFRRSQRLREFLNYVGTMALDGREGEISELSIGAAVFERRESFNPQDDNIVRSTARSLRQKLKEYAEGEGKGESLRIEVPKGSYVPVFQPAVPVEENPAPRRDAQGNFSLALAAIALASVLTAAWLLTEKLVQSNTANTANPAPSSHNGRGLLTALLEPGSHLHLVVSDVLYRDFIVATGAMYPLEDYAAKKIFEPSASPSPGKVSADLWQLIRRGGYTDIYESNAATRIAWELGSRYQVKEHHARELGMNMLQMGDNFVILGGRRANRWAELYERDLNFQMEFPPGNGSAILRNRHPRKGERDTYENVLDARQTGRTYARVALCAGLSGTGKVLLAAGNTGTGTATAADLLIQPRMLAQVEDLLGRKVDPKLQRLEMVLERDVVGGSTRDFRIVALR